MWLGRLLLRSPIGFARAFASLGPSDRRRLRTRTDLLGCPACGGREFLRHRVIHTELASSWRLNQWEREWFDEREGHVCRNCEMSMRVRSIAWTIRALNLNFAEIDVLHINQINNLSPLLSDARSLCETGFNPQVEPGADLGGLLNQDLCNLTFPDQTYDLVIHSETLEHVSDYRRALAEVTRVLKPGGLQIYTVPLLHNRRTAQRVRYRGDGTVEHRRPPSFHGLEAEDLVVWEFGGSFIRERSGSIHRIFYDDFFSNPTIFTVVERGVGWDPRKTRNGRESRGTSLQPDEISIFRASSMHQGPSRKPWIEPLDTEADEREEQSRKSLSTREDRPGSGSLDWQEHRQDDSWHVRSHQVRALRREISKQAAAYSTLENGYRNTRAHSDLLEGECRRLEDYSRRLESTTASLRGEIEDARSALAGAGQHAQQLERELEARDLVYTRLETAYKELQEYISRLEFQLQSRNAEFSDLVDW